MRDGKKKKKMASIVSGLVAPSSMQLHLLVEVILLNTWLEIKIALLKRERDMISL